MADNTTLSYCPVDDRHMFLNQTDERQRSVNMLTMSDVLKVTPCKFQWILIGCQRF